MDESTKSKFLMTPQPTEVSGHEMREFEINT